jgi:hypothetical protein
MHLKEINLSFADSDDRGCGSHNDLTIRAVLNEDGTWRVGTETRHGYINMKPDDLDGAVKSISGVRDFVQGLQKMLDDAGIKKE